MGIANLIKSTKEKFRERQRLNMKAQIETKQNSLKQLEEDVKLKKELDSIKQKELKLQEDAGRFTKKDVVNALKKAGRGVQDIARRSKENQDKAAFNQKASRGVFDSSVTKDTTKKSVFER